MSYTVYPNEIDTADQLPIATDNVTPVKAEVVNRQRDALFAIESELGVQPSGTYTTVRARLDALDLALASLSERVTTLENGGALKIQQNSVIVVSSTNIINFTGSGVAVTSGAGNTANVAITGGSGAGTLAATLAIGNTTSGNNIIVSSGDIITSTTGTNTFGGLVRTTGYIAVEQASRPYNPTGTGTGLIWVDSSTSPNQLVFSDGNGIDHVISTGGGGGETLAQTLAFGNTTGGTDIVMSSGDIIDSATGTVAFGGLIEITGWIGTEQGSRPFDPTGTNQGVVWVDGSTSPNQLIFSDESGADHVLSSIKTLAQILASGNSTSGTDIFISSGDVIDSATGIVEVNGLTFTTGYIAAEQISRPYDPTSTLTGLIWVDGNISPNRLIFTDNDGVDHTITGAIAAPLVFVAVAGRENTNVVAPDDDGKGAMPFDPTEIDGYSGLTYTFQAVLETTDTLLPAEIYLYNITDGVVVPTFNSTPLTTSSIVPVLLERSLTLSTDIPTSAKLYEVIIRFSSGTPGPNDRVTCRNAQIKVSN